MNNQSPKRTWKPKTRAQRAADIHERRIKMVEQKMCGSFHQLRAAGNSNPDKKPDEN